MPVVNVADIPKSKSDVYKEQQGNWQAAVARTLSRSLALYFSRPVRLFRPSKVSGWQSLRGLASQHGTSLSPQYILGLVKSQGFVVIPKHFIPPMLVNAMLGTILWGTFTNVQVALEPHFENHIYLNAGLAGGFAGGVQAILAAPAENARIILEGGSGGSSWSYAWKEVFQGTKSKSISRQMDIEDIRQLRGWFKEVSGMAGRGWNGWGWGLGKDICGFAAFFAIFEVTRHVAIWAKSTTQGIKGDAQQLPRMIHCLTLICGGVTAGLTYEAISFPWDTARKTVQLQRTLHPSQDRHSTIRIIVQKVYEDGLMFFCLRGNALKGPQLQSGLKRRAYGSLRTLGRVGPWGVGFLVWETYGPGLY